MVGRRLREILKPGGDISVLAFDHLPDDPARAFAHPCDVLINCTTGAPRAIADAAAFVSAQVGVLAQVPRVIHLGSMTVYGNATGVIDETHPHATNDLSPYAQAQITAETLVAACPRVVVLRPGSEYGPGCFEWSERVARWLLARRLGDLGEGGTGRCNLLFIDDLLAAIVSALRAPDIEGETFNLAAPAAPTWNEYLAAFGAALGAPPLRRRSPVRLFVETRLWAVPLKIAEIFFRRLGRVPAWLPPAIPPSLPALCRQDIRLDSRKAEAKLGLRWTPLAQGLRKTVEARRTRSGT